MLANLSRQLLLMLVSISPVLASGPANPDAGVPPARYSPVISGTKSFRPVEPLPWGDVNRRVMPPEQNKGAPKGREDKRGPQGRP
jgi:hypothetical protein